jgi:hypothetical protein
MFSGGITLGISLLTSFRGGSVTSAMLLPPVTHKKVRLDISDMVRPRDSNKSIAAASIKEILSKR